MFNNQLKVGYCIVIDCMLSTDYVDDDLCMICMETTTERVVCENKCFIYAHSECLAVWYARSNNTCIICKRLPNKQANVAKLDVYCGYMYNGLWMLTFLICIAFFVNIFCNCV